MHITAKPKSFNCNLKCKYCFYLEKENYFEDAKLMNDNVLEEFIKNYIRISGDDVFFTWQGGEPTLAGLPFFEKVIQFQDKYKGNKKICNSLQTNGILINKKWCKFLKRHNFLIGISIDGTQEMHDHYRVNNANHGTFTRVINAINLFKENDIEFNTLTVINDVNVQHPLLIYRFLKKIGSTHLQFIELLETKDVNDDYIPIWMGGEKSPDFMPFSSPSVAFGNFMKTIFREWIEKDVGTIYVRQFETFISRFVGNGHSVCIFQPSCGDNLALEANGDIYECDHYVYPTHKLGNINNLLFHSFHGKKVDNAKQNLSDSCLKCLYKDMCNGGCPKHRITNADGQTVSYFCEGYKILFGEITPYMNAFRELINKDIPPYKIMPLVPQIRQYLENNQ